MATSYGEHSVEEFLDAVASKEAAPGGGSTTAVTAGLAAGLVAMAARFSKGRPGVEDDVVETADNVRTQALGLAGADADAYAQVLAALQIPKDRREETLQQALTDASEVQLTVAQIGADVARLASVLVKTAKPDVRGDARSGLLLAEASVRSAAQLVAANVRMGDLDDDLVRRAEALGAQARTALEGGASTSRPATG